jgi:hypothetical protein
VRWLFHGQHKCCYKRATTTCPLDSIHRLCLSGFSHHGQKLLTKNKSGLNCTAFFLSLFPKQCSITAIYPVFTPHEKLQGIQRWFKVYRRMGFSYAHPMSLHARVLQILPQLLEGTWISTDFGIHRGAWTQSSWVWRDDFIWQVPAVCRHWALHSNSNSFLHPDPFLQGRSCFTDAELRPLNLFNKKTFHMKPTF